MFGAAGSSLCAAQELDRTPSITEVVQPLFPEFLVHNKLIVDRLAVGANPIWWCTPLIPS